MACWVGIVYVEMVVGDSLYACGSELRVKKGDILYGKGVRD
jgi:hypothetical protein